MFISLDDKTLVAGQIAAADMAAAASQGVSTIINNRPDGEEPGQPTAASLRSAAESAGLVYHHIPVAGGVSAPQVAETAEVLAQSAGKVLLFCRSGTRSTYLWALARASDGADPQSLAEQAAVAGYDLSPLLPHLGR